VVFWWGFFSGESMRVGFHAADDEMTIDDDEIFHRQPLDVLLCAGFSVWLTMLTMNLKLFWRGGYIG